MSNYADSLQGEVVLLTGATGALGRAFADHVLQRGGCVAATVRRGWQVEKLTAALGLDRTLVGVVGAQDSEAAAGFVKGANDALGPITALVCTAGMHATPKVGRDPAGQLSQLVEANLLAPANLTRAVLPGMQRRRRGTLTYVGSAAVGADSGQAANYLASKAALHEFVRALASEIHSFGMRAAAILPDTLDTEANRKAMPDVDPRGWVSMEQAVEALSGCAFGSPQEGGPLYPLLPNR